MARCARSHRRRTAESWTWTSSAPSRTSTRTTVGTCPLQAYDGQNSKRVTILYASNRDVFVFLVDEARPIDVDGQTYFRGFYTQVPTGRTGRGKAPMNLGQTC